MPRNLQLLQIDDDLLQPRRPSEFIDPVQIEAAYKYGISDWLASIEFWSKFNENVKIDLVTADIRFTADKTTPLLYDISFQRSEESQQSGEFLIPTGLSHVKPFAAIARAGGRPLGVAIHTADVDGWKARRASPNIAARVMAYLAAQEIGELAAILGDRLDLVDKSKEEVLEACWSWLSRRTYTTFNEAWPRALESYREYLVRKAFRAESSAQKGETGSGELKNGFVIVLPTDWIRLAAWCERMKRAGEGAVLQNDDPGFRFLLRDGSRETISFRSLFADAHLALPYPVDLKSEALPRECFDLKLRESAFKLDDKMRPQIGAFLMEFKDPAEAYKLAVEALDYFPVEARAPKKLGDILTVEKCGSLVQLARLFAILFQVVRRDRSIVEAWENAYERDAWDMTEACFRLEIADSGKPSLKQIVQRVSERVGSFQDGFTTESLLESYNLSLRDCDQARAGRETIECCTRILESLGLVFYREEDKLYDVNEWRPVSEAIPPVPTILPDGVIEVGDVRSQDTGPFLRDVFGYGSPPNDNQIGRFIGEALGVEAARAAREGRQFLSEFRDGAAPIWIKEICRIYATDKLLWPRAESWPRALK
jgi:hypothetical protein